MKVTFRGKFNKDVSAIQDTKVLEAIKATILTVEAAGKIADIKGIKKIKGSKSAFRIKIGELRIGLDIEKGTVDFVRVLPRKDIYKYFP